MRGSPRRRAYSEAARKNSSSFTPNEPGAQTTQGTVSQLDLRQRRLNTTMRFG
jgi:hypothetical protein